MKRSLIIIGLCMLFLVTGMVSATDYYVNVSSAACSDSSPTGNITNPYCLLITGLGVISSGDNLYLATGIYNYSIGNSLTNKRFTSTTTISSAPGNNAQIIPYVTSFFNPGTSWKNMSGVVNGLWNFSYSSSADILSVMRYDNNETYFVHETYANAVNTALVEGCWYDEPNNYLYCRFDDIGNPNDYQWVVSKAVALTLTNVTNLLIANLTFIGGQKSIYVSSTGPSTNITIDSCNFIGSTGSTSSSQGTGIIDVRGGSNVLIKNCYVEQKRSEEWDWNTAKSSPMESTAIRFEDSNEGINITNNKIYSVFNGIMALTTGAGHFSGLDIGYNNISNVIDDGIEPEGKFSIVNIHHNRINDTYTGISLMPFNCTVSGTGCEVEYNVVVANRSQLMTAPSTYSTGECFKLAGNYAEGIRNTNISHNTCVGRGVYMSDSQDNEQYNNNWLDNIFYSNIALTSGRNIDMSGLAVNDVFYDYNLYFRTSSTNALFTRWNNHTRTTEYNLSTALASSSWDGTWDTNSTQADPLFTNISTRDFTPLSTSPACNAASDGTDIGALPCADSVTAGFVNCTEVTVNNPESETLVDFPLMINISYRADMQSDFDDVRFYSGICGAETSLLYAELEMKNDNESAIVWIKTNLSTGNNNISMRYGNNTATNNWDSSGNVWNSNTVAVYLLNGTAKDSTSNQYNGTVNGATSNTGRIGNAYSFNGTQWINSSSYNLTQLNGDVSFSAFVWINSNSTSAATQGVLGKDVNTVRNWYMMATSNDLNVRLYNSTLANACEKTTAVNTVTMGFWHYVGFTWNTANNNLTIWNDGIKIGEMNCPSMDSLVINNNPFLIGTYYSKTSAYSFNGTIDDVKIYNTSLSSSWVNASYQFVANYDSFIRFGDVEYDDDCVYLGVGNFTIINTTCSITEDYNLYDNWIILTNSYVTNTMSLTNGSISLEGSTFRGSFG